MGKAVAYFANGIGNFVMMMPALQALRDMTGAQVDIVLPDAWMDQRKPVIEEVCEEWNVIGKVIHHPTESIPDVYEHWFWSAHGSNHDAVLAFRSRMRHRPVSKPHWRTSMVHERDHYMQIVRSMGYRGSVPRVEFPFAKGPILDCGRPIVGFCNGAFATNYWKKKWWNGFPRLAEVMKMFFGGSVVGVGGEGELDGTVCDMNFCGKLSIMETAKVISQVDLLVATDTGNMHIADIIGVPLISLFGSTLVSKNGPVGERSVVVASTISCAPCFETGLFFSCTHNECMRSITVGDVMNRARRMI